MVCLTSYHTYPGSRVVDGLWSVEPAVVGSRLAHRISPWSVDTAVQALRRPLAHGQVIVEPRTAGRQGKSNPGQLCHLLAPTHYVVLHSV